MGSILNSMLGRGNSRAMDDYLQVDFGGEATTTTESETDVNVHFARIATNKDLLDVKDVLYAGDIVIVELAPVDGMKLERVVQQLKDVAEDVNGDIAQKTADEVIITPSGVGVSRTQIGRN